MDIQPVLSVYLALIAFGVVYNACVSWLERKGYSEGYMGLIVAFGVGVTVAATAVIDWRFALIVLGAFVASGTPMILGSVWRHVTAREKDQQELRHE